ncbi:MAG: hypothetical protein L0287_02665 [Anaerolineae bacterium]|nr:hypothetical protein [Anaerolineae bacterium]MCI0608354.1 hypothetical protein [Anaerolineae bacterium]
MNFNFGEVLTRAWQIVWKHKILWVFGILASCGRGGSNFNSGSSGGGDGGSGTPPDLPPQAMEWFRWVEENAVTFFALVCVFVLLIWLVTKAIGAVGKIGLIRGTAQVEGSTEQLIFGQLFSEGTPYFGRMFGLLVLVDLPILALALVVIVMAIAFVLPVSQAGDAAVTGMFSMVALFGVCICLFIPIMIVVYLIANQSERAIVLEEMRVLPAISRGWDVFRNNLGPIIVMAIILAVISFVVGFIIAIPILIVVVPTMFAFMAGEAQNWTPLAIAGVCICLYIPISLLLNGIAIAYTESAWTLTYMRLTKPPVSEPIPLPDTNA